MVKNSPEYQKEYMKNYIANAKDVLCKCGSTYKPYRKYMHVKTKKHLAGIDNNIKQNEVQNLMIRIEALENRL